MAMMRYNCGYRNLRLSGGMLKVSLAVISSDRLHLLAVKKCSSKAVSSCGGKEHELEGLPDRKGCIHAQFVEA